MSNQQLMVSRYDILSETCMQTEIRANSLGLFYASKWNEGSEWTALSHPSNNSIFLMNGGEVYLFDN